MKNLALFVFFLFVGTAAAQTSVNDYQMVIIPSRFEIQSEPNQYRLNTHAKKLLEEAGFSAVHESMMTAEQGNRRCDFLIMDVVKVKSILTVKIKVIFKDCRNNIVFESADASAKEKEYAVAYPEALRKAFESVKALGYQYSGKVGTGHVSAPVTQTTVAEPVAVAPQSGYVLETLASGYLIIDAATSRIALKILRTSDPKTYIASRGGENGVFLNKSGKWFFEHYKDDKLYSEEFKVGLQ